MAARRRRPVLYPQIAAALRAALEQRGWTIPDLNEKLGRTRGYVNTYNWVNGVTAPTKEFRTKLSKVLGLGEAALTPQALPAPTAAKETPSAPRTPRATDVLAFTVDDEGKARIRLDVTLPTERAMPLLRLLMDAHIVDGE